MHTDASGVKAMMWTFPIGRTSMFLNPCVEMLLRWDYLTNRWLTLIFDYIYSCVILLHETRSHNRYFRFPSSFLHNFLSSATSFTADLTCLQPLSLVRARPKPSQFAGLCVCTRQGVPKGQATRNRFVRRGPCSVPFPRVGRSQQ